MKNCVMRCTSHENIKKEEIIISNMGANIVSITSQLWNLPDFKHNLKPVPKPVTLVYVGLGTDVNIWILTHAACVQTLKSAMCGIWYCVSSTAIIHLYMSNFYCINERKKLPFNESRTLGCFPSNMFSVTIFVRKVWFSSSFSPQCVDVITLF